MNGCETKRAQGRESAPARPGGQGAPTSSVRGKRNEWASSLREICTKMLFRFIIFVVIIVVIFVASRGVCM